MYDTEAGADPGIFDRGVQTLLSKLTLFYSR